MDRAATFDTVALVSYQRDQLNRLRKNMEKAVDTGDIEAVHDLRVASRRLHEALGLILGGPCHKRVSSARELLKDIRGSFRRVRDLDVLLLALGDSAATTILGEEAVTRVEGILAARRKRAVETAIRMGRRQRVGKGLDAIEEQIGRWEKRTNHGCTDIDERFESMFRRRTTDLLAADPREETTDMHETRIRVKRLRYCAQLGQECGDHDKNALVAELSGVQCMLGQWNDRVVAARTFGRLAGRRRMLAACTSVSLRLFEYAKHHAQTAMDDRQKVLVCWPRLITLIQRALPDENGNEIVEDVACSAESASEPVKGDD